jgi:hypothetical protein
VRTPSGGTVLRAPVISKGEKDPKALIVNVFELDETLMRYYERFARSFTQIRAPDIRVHVEEI